jgi:hypothetical protein
MTLYVRCDVRVSTVQSIITIDLVYLSDVTSERLQLYLFEHMTLSVRRDVRAPFPGGHAAGGEVFEYDYLF